MNRLLSPARAFALVAIIAVSMAPLFASSGDPSRGRIGSSFEVETRSDPPTVRLRLWMARDRVAQTERYRIAVAVALTHFSAWFGPCPFTTLTLVDATAPAFSGDGPTVVVSTGHTLAPGRSAEPEGSILSAIAGYWFNADDSTFARALALYAGGRALAEEYANASFVGWYFGGHIPWLFPGLVVADAARRDGPAEDPAAETARWLATAERHVGWPALQTALSAFSGRTREKPGTLADLQHELEEVTGRELSWFFDQMRARARVDFAIERVTTEAGGSDRKTLRTTVAVSRKGNAIFPGRSPSKQSFGAGRGPIPVDLRFTNGESVTEWWDGIAAREWTYLSTAPLAVAQIDASRMIAADIVRVNNSWTAQPKSAPASWRWSARWLVWLEHCMLAMSALV